MWTVPSARRTGPRFLEEGFRGPPRAREPPRWMHHCKRYHSPEPEPYMNHRRKRRRSRSKEHHEGRPRYPTLRDFPRRSRSRSQDRLPYQRGYRDRMDSELHKFEEPSPSFVEDYYSTRRSRHHRRSRERHRTRKHQHHCRKRRTRSCSSTSSTKLWAALAKGLLAKWWSAWTTPGRSLFQRLTGLLRLLLPKAEIWPLYL
ncbi:PREDICTED: dual specificity protein kinase CLK3-like isoform X2 [Thamnophis sirtalis]|uniref:Dual specificity protein kinase CLK3-like isoform X2 n=1 Tax=Thamnophis sirtalis TaxID=35019 RepID=A0A6I9YUM5_9SAUR|nr:PREDICTED: dual specificity protein kinase CLK3-like isoform X2 [Thamnophis sirtalis]